MFWRRRRRVRRRKRTSVTRHYARNKEQARAVILQRIEKYVGVYGFAFGRVAVRNTKSRWGSCSTKGNLNFSYRILFLPEHLADYIVVHELCHLQELNHSPRFWQLVAQTVPDYKERRKALRNNGQKHIYNAA
ncbi:MAG TPA: M48 family metallopeptidase [Candidatus Paceibacterota bacterium]